MSPTLTGTTATTSLALPDTDHTTNRKRHTEMNTMHEDLARAHMATRLGEARQMRAGQQLARARRLSRKAERAAQQARLALARAL